MCMKCKHVNCNKVNTYEGIEMIIVDTNYQCAECGKILSPDEYQDILTDDCSWCNGSGEHEMQGEKYTCGCRKIIDW